MTNIILQGDARYRMSAMEDNSVDAIITDPPYGLNFMGKKWDYDVPDVLLWKEAMRVLKPGGYLLSFAGTRTYHRMAVNIEDAGFEIRDTIMWLYGSGFPKSLNIGKQIEKLNPEKIEYGEEKKGAGNNNFVGETNNLKPTYKEVIIKNEWEGWGTAIKPSHEDIVVAQKPLNTLNHINILCQLKEYVQDVERSLRLIQVGLKEGKTHIAVENVQILQEEEKVNSTEIGKVENSKEVMDISQFTLEMVNTNLNTILLWKNLLEEILIEMNKSTILMEKEMTTDLKILNSLIGQVTYQNIIQVEKSQVNGLTANALLVENNLKSVLIKSRLLNITFVQENVISKENNLNLSPNSSPIVVARKPLSEKNVALNVLKWGTGGINIDACRVGTTGARFNGRKVDSDIYGKYGTSKPKEDYNMGRFPANIILDEEAGRLLDEQSGKCKTGDINNNLVGFKKGCLYGNSKMVIRNYKTDKPTGASRFFYCAKASKSERNEGLDELPDVNTKGSIGLNTVGGTPTNYEECRIRKNHHPTVKPIKLMEYLVKLVSKEGATILDPFLGSGTTAIACIKQGRKFIGIELNKEYIEIAEARINKVKEQKTLIQPIMLNNKKEDKND